MNNNAELAKKLRNWQLHLDTIPDIIEEAAAALEAPPAGIDWRLIADMPDALKDGREVLGFSDDWGATTMMYEKGGIPPFWSVDVWDFLPANSGLHQYEILPTHYAEITPPAAASGEPELESAKVWDSWHPLDQTVRMDGVGIFLGTHYGVTCQKTAKARSFNGQVVHVRIIERPGQPCEVEIVKDPPYAASNAASDQNQTHADGSKPLK